MTNNLYQETYQESLQNPEIFWSKIAKQIEWFAPFSEPVDSDSLQSSWFPDGSLNISHNCLDRHVRDGRGAHTAFVAITESGKTTRISYAELLARVEHVANGLRSLGLVEGDRVVIYMPVVVEQAVAMLACARLGLVHSVVFGGFSAPALEYRLNDLGARVLITATHTTRRGKNIDLLSVARTAKKNAASVENVVVLLRESSEKVSNAKLADSEISFADLESRDTSPCPPVARQSSDPLFVLYTSGTTGQPKGIVHATGGYSVYSHFTTKTTFDLRADDVYWCTADPGWITGHSYVVYGPLSNGVTSLLVEGAPDFPDAGRWWKIIEQEKVNVFYTAPTAVRLLMRAGDAYPQKYDLSSLRVMGSVGEPINPAAWQWLFDVVGEGKAEIVDTWWQTETGGHMLVTLPGLTQKPGIAGLPFFGVAPLIVDDHNHPVEPGNKGHLVITKPWPGAFTTCWNNHARFEKYFSEYPPYYHTGDMAIQDADGYFQILGRSDDILNIAGHRLGTAEVESALVSHPAVGEAAAIAVPHEITGEKLVAYVILRNGFSGSDQLEQELIEHVKQQIGRFAIICQILFADTLPKTRSGKIMRRVLRAELTGEAVGDTSTLED